MSKLKIKFDMWTIVFSAYLFNQFYFRSFVSVQRILLLGSLMLYVLINWGTVKKLAHRTVLKRTVQLCAIGFALWILVSVLIPLLHGTNDFSYLSYCFTFFSWALYLLAVLVRIQKKYPNRDLFQCFMELFIIGNCLYVIMTGIMLVIPAFRDLILSFIYMSDHQRELLLVSKFYTRIGWSGFSAYTNALKCSLAFGMVLSIMYNQISFGGKIRPSAVTASVILLAGNAFYARTGLLCCAACLGVFILFLLKHTRYWEKAVKYMLILLFLLIVGLAIIQNYSDNDVIGWMFEALINYSDNGAISTMSSDILMDMYFMPDVATLLFGDGIYTAATGGYYMGTDAGVMRLVLYGGVFFALLIYYVIAKLISGVKKFAGESEKLLAMVMALVFIIFEIKGESIVIIFPIVLALCLVRRQRCQEAI